MSDDEDIKLGAKTFSRVKIPIQQDGFREGFEIGRVDSFQPGYDLGYKTAFKAAFNMGFYNAAFRVVSSLESAEEKKKLFGLTTEVYQRPDKGTCILCPKVNRKLTKQDMAKVIPGDTVSVDDMVANQNKAISELERENHDIHLWLKGLIEDENQENVNTKC